MQYEWLNSRVIKISDEYTSIIFNDNFIQTIEPNNSVIIFKWHTQKLN